MLSTLVRRAAAPPTTKFNINMNRYRAKKLWPPDFTQLSQKHQFRLERRYRRRAKLKWARPGWNKFIKLATWSSIGFVLVYSVFFMDTPDEQGSPFDMIRKWYTSTTDDMFSRDRPRLTTESPQHDQEERKKLV